MFGTLYLTNKGIGAVKASAITGIIGGVILPAISPAVTCGSYAGMSSVGVATMTDKVSLAIATTVSFLMSQNIFRGIGGKLGLVALFSGTLLQYMKGNLATFEGYKNLVFLKEIFSSFKSVKTLTDAQQSLVVVQQALVPQHYFLSIFAGALGTLILRTKLSLNPMLSSGIMGLASSVAFPGMDKMVSLLYLGSFVGMSNTDYTPLTWIPIKAFIASAVTTAVFVIADQIFSGLGGKLGAIAFCGVVVPVYFQKLVSYLYTLLPTVDKRKNYNVLARVISK